MKIIIIIFVLYIFYHQVYNLSDKWIVTKDMSTLESKKLKYSHLIYRNLSRNVRRASDSDGRILFPDSESKIILNPISTYRPIGPVPICYNSTFCVHASHYPTDYVKNAVRSRNDLRYLATINEVNKTTTIDERIAPSSFGVRPQAVDTYDDNPLCLVHEQVVFPKSGENKQKEWVFIVNDDEFPQGVRIETCMSENGPCRIIDGFAEGYKTSCRQKYIYRQLAAISQDGTISPDLFRFPSSCCCHVKFIGNPLTRMNSGVKLNSEMSLKK